MRLEKNISLKPYNTFGIDAVASHFFAFANKKQLIDFINKGDCLHRDIFVLGGGSNVLLSGNYNGLIIHPVNKGIRVIDETDVCVSVEVEAGEEWDSFVAWAVENELYGIENLSAIPGSVGAVPVQNIGAYGTEVRNVIKLVKAVEIKTANEIAFLNYECKFGYRDSIFKNQLKNKVIITSVIFSLTKLKNLNLNYSDLTEYFKHKPEPFLSDVRKAVCEIRDAKLPDYKIMGNAGSFFKNPVVLKSEIETLKEKFSDIRYFDFTSNHVKLAAGWLIDQCGLKGFELNKAGVHKHQALVLVNLGGAEGKDIIALANYVKSKVFDKFGVELEFEVNIIPV